MFNLAMMYDSGDGVTQNYMEAVKWFTLAAKQGVTPAQNILGVMYYYGDGVVQDYAMAHMWANVAAANGYEKARNLRDTVAEKMTQADIAVAQQMASKCLASNYENCGY